MYIDKNFSELTEKELKELCYDPDNLEDKNIENKVRYSRDTDELRRDIISLKCF